MVGNSPLSRAVCQILPGRVAARGALHRPGLYFFRRQGANLPLERNRHTPNLRLHVRPVVLHRRLEHRIRHARRSSEGFIELRPLETPPSAGRRRELSPAPEACAGDPDGSVRASNPAPASWRPGSRCRRTVGVPRRSPARRPGGHTWSASRPRSVERRGPTRGWPSSVRPPKA